MLLGSRHAAACARRVSNLSRQIKNPARAKVSTKLRERIDATYELPVPSVKGTGREEFEFLGLTDAVILHLCELGLEGLAPTLLTADADLADRAVSLGCEVIDFDQWREA